MKYSDYSFWRMIPNKKLKVMLEFFYSPCKPIIVVVVRGFVLVMEEGSGGADSIYPALS